MQTTARTQWSPSRTSHRNHLFALVMTLGLAAGGLSLTAPAVDASPAWSIVPSPTPTGSSSAFLDWVSCPTTTNCIAVGYERGGTTNEALTEHWNGSSWSILPNRTRVTLRGVSCPSTTSCFAVGSAIEHWNGSSWSVIYSPSPANSTLVGVSCHSTTSCFAVGFSYTGGEDKTLIEHWNGSAWSITPSPSPARVGVNGISCPSTTSCFMFGYDELADNQTRTLIEHWNGTSWSIVTSANRAGAAENQLFGAACPSTTSCVAVGFSATAGVGRVVKTLVERWDGKTWSITTSPNPTNSQQTQIIGVSCNGMTNCFAVGNRGSNAGGTPGSTLIEHWDGKSWSIMTSPNPGGAPGSALGAISCPGTTTCFAIGGYNSDGSPKTLIERYA